MMVVGVVAGGVTSGISAAHTTCDDEQKTQEAIQATQAFVSESQKRLAYLQGIDDGILNQITNLSIASMTACNELQSIRKAYISKMQKMQMIALFIVIIVFMLLLGKKLKLY